MNVVPCPLCGYDTRGREASGVAATAGAGLCGHCGLAPLDASLGAPRAGPWSGVGVGFAALPRGLHYLATTRGVKRWLVPPLLITLAAFAALFIALWRAVEQFIVWVEQAGARELDIDPEWVRKPLEWLLGLKAFLWLTQISSLVMVLTVSAVAAFWAFSIVYEAVSGPFLDEIHGRIEARWFGRDPRNALYRPTALSSRECALHSAGAAGAGLVLALVYWALGGPHPVPAALALQALSFGVLGAVRREFGRWLAWIVRLEGGTLWVSVKAALIAGLILVLFFPLKFVPIVGFLLFGMVAGFTTAVSLLDIPCERRQWSLRQRLSFLLRNVPAVVAFGTVASLLFVLPVIGPVLMVPAASVGGLWMLCRLDKDFLRPNDQRLGRAPERRASPVLPSE
jgi:uncharacterized protein involved in cysteine biosynthesis